jgi:DNA-binding transcriptional regulator YhcF (GntR family)
MVKLYPVIQHISTLRRVKLSEEQDTENIAPLESRELGAKRDEIAKEKLIKDIAYYKSLGLSLDEVVDMIKRHYGD